MLENLWLPASSKDKAYQGISKTVHERPLFYKEWNDLARFARAFPLPPDFLIDDVVEMIDNIIEFFPCFLRFPGQKEASAGQQLYSVEKYVI